MKAKGIRKRFVRIYSAVKSPKYFINRTVKDRLFRYIFSKDKEALLELYNALHDTSYKSTEDMEIVTVDSVVYMSMKNDIAFVLYGIIQLYEHQGSYNPNMPARFLIYLGQEYEKLITVRKENLYGSRLIKLPTPQCVVFYNGSTDMPESTVLRLSDAFENKEVKSSVELTVRMININLGHNRELMEKCRKLYEYSYFVDQIKRNRDRGMGLRKAVDNAVNHCIEEDILADILEEHRMEVIGMLINEFNERKHWKLVTRAAIEEGRKTGEEIGQKIGQEIGRAEGLAEGEHKTIISLICRKLRKGKTPEQIADELEEPLERVKLLCAVADSYAPDYDIGLIYNEIYTRQQGGI